MFDKGYTPNWTEEVFMIDKIKYTKPITYKLKDLNDEKLQVSFYELELLKARMYSELKKLLGKIIRKNKR